MLTVLSISTHAPRVGGDAPYTRRCRRSHYFYSRPRVGGDLRWQDVNHYAVFISTHAPAWGATRILLKPTEYLRFLLTPPRRGRQNSFSIIRKVCHISTHAPAWGATRGHRSGDQQVPISTHAPVWGGDMS